MKKNMIAFIVLINSFGLSCAETNSKEMVSLSGEKSGTSDVVKFRSIDEGPFLMDDDYNFPTKLDIQSGKHTLSVMCDFVLPDGKNIALGMIEIDVEAGKHYQLTGQLVDADNSCKVSIEEAK